MTRVNLQQIPKVREVLEAFNPPPGWGLVDSDLQAVEPRVIAYFSRDPQYLELFASGRVHDVYLYVAMALFPEHRDAIRAVYYLPDGTTTTESVEAAKVKFKKLRGIAKELHLSAMYGAGAGRIYSSLRVKGIQVTFEEVKAMRDRYWALFRGVRDWGQQLLAEREDRGGWILNGRGRPLAIADAKVKDIMNTFCQSTGHDCLLTLVWRVDSLARARGVPMRPWLVDFHDETTWAYQLGHEAAVRAVFEDAYTALNAELQADVPLLGNIDFGASLAEFKL